MVGGPHGTGHRVSPGQGGLVAILADLHPQRPASGTYTRLTAKLIDMNASISSISSGRLPAARAGYLANGRRGFAAQYIVADDGTYAYRLT